MGRTLRRAVPPALLFLLAEGFSEVEIGEAAMITHAPESKVIAASSSFELRFMAAESNKAREMPRLQSGISCMLSRLKVLS